MLQCSILCVILSVQNVLSSNEEFVCPKDGRWPHPLDCEKYYTCNTGISIEGWCGLGMTYDPDHQRCDLSKNIECQNGERPSWTPPEGWLQSESVTSYVITKTTEDHHDDDDDFEVEKQTRPARKRKTTTTRATLMITKIAQYRVTLPVSALVENTECTFQDNTPDPDNCQAYYTCKEDMITRIRCPDRQLFDEDNRLCNDYRKVFCGNRPTNERENDPCISQQNGWYADIEHQCRVYYLCTEQRKSKMGECLSGSKWNSQRLRCDDPRNIPAPCGLRSNKGVAFSSASINAMIAFSLFTFQQIVCSWKS